jgi:hypothetical protein
MAAGHALADPDQIVVDALIGLICFNHYRRDIA